MLEITLFGLAAAGVVMGRLTIRAERERRRQRKRLLVQLDDILIERAAYDRATLGRLRGQGK